ALLVYASHAPSRAVFYPFAVFSPEWQAILYALERDIPVRFMDLPFAYQVDQVEETGDIISKDPLEALARAAGYADRELWWEHHVEQRDGAHGAFEAILEAMSALREGHVSDPREARREAHMRKMLRTAERTGFARIAVVCGAWHGPALASSTLAAHASTDARILEGLVKTKTEATWIPWTHSRLSQRSGYGAGVTSPGWYAHLWESSPRRASLGWIARTARLLREADIDAPPASVIDAVRLADALASMRALSMPGLAELTDATSSVFCRGESAPLALIRTKLEIGTARGEVPEDAPQVPLARDVSAAQRRLRLKPSAEPRSIELDLRSPRDREKSHLLHRLNALEVRWGQLQAIDTRKAGSFHEHWRLDWRPEMTVSLVEASLFGNTLASAATAKLAEAARGAHLARLTTLLDLAILAELPEATERVLAFVQERSALSADVLGLMEALPPLARTTRYGSTRQTRAGHLEAILDGLFERIVIGLVPACASLDDRAAARMLAATVHVHESILLLDRPKLRDAWTALLRALLDCGSPAMQGGACRLLLERGNIAPEELERRARLALSAAARPAHAAAWLEGLLHGSALLLLHHDGLWNALDAWLLSLSEEAFVDMLPLVRRAFANFGPAERRHLGERVRRMESPARSPVAPPARPDRDAARAALVLPVLSCILGVELP
ncbi:MAG TPA: DUF5682 family protein, partial [Polyangiaceae bacterium]|nr:DUF5682 family protein [Polyangiaceae bacterium]